MVPKPSVKYLPLFDIGNISNRNEYGKERYRNYDLLPCYEMRGGQETDKVYCHCFIGDDCSFLRNFVCTTILADQQSVSDDKENHFSPVLVNCDRINVSFYTTVHFVYCSV